MWEQVLESTDEYLSFFYLDFKISLFIDCSLSVKTVTHLISYFVDADLQTVQ